MKPLTDALLDHYAKEYLKETEVFKENMSFDKYVMIKEEERKLN